MKNDPIVSLKDDPLVTLKDDRLERKKERKEKDSKKDRKKERKNDRKKTDTFFLSFGHSCWSPLLVTPVGQPSVGHFAFMWVTL